MFGGFFKQKIEARIAADEDLKLADLLKYYLRESQAAKVWQLKSPVKKLALLNIAVYVMMSPLAGSLVPEESGFGRLWER